MLFSKSFFFDSPQRRQDKTKELIAHGLGTAHGNEIHEILLP
jgi:hypothetical protein